jgi:hypothetical protein
VGLLLVVGSSTAFVTACGAAHDETTVVQGELTLQQARAFPEFPLAYAGERVDGLPLTAIIRRRDSADYVSFVYGDCHPVSSDGGCAPPTEIQVWPGDRRSVGMYDVGIPGTPAATVDTVRGNAAAFFDEGTRLEIYAGAATVVIFADSPGRVRKVAGALRCVGEAERGEAERLMC